MQGRQALHLACLNGHVDAALALTSKGEGYGRPGANTARPALVTICESYIWRATAPATGALPRQ